MLKTKEDEIDQLEEILKDRDNIVGDLERQLELIPNPTIPKKILYRPIKGDLLDEMIAKYINDLQIPIPVRRLGDGNYLFGTKKVFAKI